MTGKSANDVIVSSVIAISCMAFLTGFFLAISLHFWLLGAGSFLLYLVVLPLFSLAIVLHTSRILRAFPERSAAGGKKDR
jgi:hypothetical protein